MWTTLSIESFSLCEKLVPDEVKSRYEFCNYIINHNKFRLRKVVALVQRFVRILLKRVDKGSNSSHTDSNTDSQQKKNYTEGTKW